MEPKVIVMIVTTLLPSGDNGVQVMPQATVDTCIQAANHEASDPKVQQVECAELADGRLVLQFGDRLGPAPALKPARLGGKGRG